MNRILMKPFGVILTGRPYGNQVSADLQKKYPDGGVELDFKDVVGLGSSFGEEVILPFAKRQGNKMKIYSAASPVVSCLELIAKDFGISFEFA